jgi:hypothetical protein
MLSVVMVSVAMPVSITAPPAVVSASFAQENTAAYWYFALCLELPMRPTRAHISGRAILSGSVHDFVAAVAQLLERRRT